MLKEIQNAFHCNVGNLYCTTEGGEVAVMCKEGHMHLNDDFIILEPVNDDNNVVKKGEVSTGVLITDLANFATPIIRYKLNDSIKILDKPCPCNNKHMAFDLVGRVPSKLNICNKDILPVSLYLIMYEKSFVYSWQFAQTAPDTLEFRCILPEDIDKKEFKEWITKKVNEFFKSYDINPKFIYSDKEPRHQEKGGKILTVVKEF